MGPLVAPWGDYDDLPCPDQHRIVAGEADSGGNERALELPIAEDHLAVGEDMVDRTAAAVEGDHMPAVAAAAVAAAAERKAAAGCRDVGRNWGGSFGRAADYGPEDAAGVGHVPELATAVAAAADIHQDLAVDAGQDTVLGAEDHRAELGVEAVEGCIRTGSGLGSQVWHRAVGLENDDPLCLLFRHDHHDQVDSGMEDTVDSHRQLEVQVEGRVVEDRNCRTWWRVVWSSRVR